MMCFMNGRPGGALPARTGYEITEIPPFLNPKGGPADGPQGTGYRDQGSGEEKRIGCEKLLFAVGVREDGKHELQDWIYGPL
jgi:hypothetical protein